MVPIPYPITVERPEVVQGVTLLDRGGLTPTEGEVTIGGLNEVPSRGLTLLGCTSESSEISQR